MQGNGGDRPYRLSAELHGHSGDVKAVVAASNGSFYSVSRDGTGRAWNRGADGIEAGAVFKGQTGYINSVAWIPPNAKHVHGLLVTGGQDALISIYDPLQPDEPLYVLVGHSGNVCALDVDPSGSIISGSWDSTAKVWKDWACSSTLEGHESSVWAVLFLDAETIITASADKSIRIWHQGKMTKKISVHKDCVRGLTRLSSGDFASCANDGEIITFDRAGHKLEVLNGHESYVYSIKEIGPGTLVSSGEDRTVRIWSGAACIQTITHPAISIWSVAVCPNGDIISGASDNVVRVFSRDPSREADADTLRAFSEQVSQQARPAQEIGNIQKDSLPGSEALSKRGKKEGQVIMIRNGNVVEAHQWTESTQSWSKVGEVVDAIGSDRKQMFDGKEYDYVFDVDISENAPPLKLPYNANENPFAAAQSFVKKNELPEQYVDEVANFIMKNTKGSTIDTQQYSDPFTGAGRYIPGAPSTNGSTPQAGPTSTSSHERMTKVLPHRTFLFLKQGNMLAIKQKLAALNKALRTGEHKIVSLNPTQEQRLLALADSLSTLEDPETGKVLVHVMTEWPESDRFPGLDLARLAAGSTPALASLESRHGDAIETLLVAAQLNGHDLASFDVKEKEINVMLCLRTFANLFSTTPGSTLMLSHANQLLACLGEISKVQVKATIALAVSTILLNYSILSLEGSLTDNLATLQTVSLGFCHEKGDSEALYRSLVALGNTLHASGQSGIEGDLASQISTTLRSLEKRGREESRLAEIMTEIKARIS